MWIHIINIITSFTDLLHFFFQSVLPLHTHICTHHVEQIPFHSVSCVLQSSSSLVAIRSLYIMARAVYIERLNNGAGLFVCFFTNLCSSADQMTKIIIAQVFIHSTLCFSLVTPHVEQSFGLVTENTPSQCVNPVNFHFVNNHFTFVLSLVCYFITLIIYLNQHKQCSLHACSLLFCR